MEPYSICEEKQVIINNHKLLKPPNIYLVGAQCIGKTTLLEALRTHFVDAKNRDFHNQYVEAPVMIEEVVREVMRSKGFNVNDIKQPERGLELQQYTIQA
jgi:chromosomal replication initiation ATPase DnaA